MDYEFLSVGAKAGELDRVLSFIEERLDAHGCGPRAAMQILVSAEEIFINIANYAYPEGEGRAEVGIAFDEDGCRLRFADGGIPFNPLKVPDPDVTLSAKERKIGGLGIYMAKKAMDGISYEYADGKNILVMKRSLS